MCQYILRQIIAIIDLNDVSDISRSNEGQAETQSGEPKPSSEDP